MVGLGGRTLITPSMGREGEGGGGQSTKPNIGDFAFDEILEQR